MDHDRENPNHPQDTRPAVSGYLVFGATVCLACWLFGLYWLIIRPVFGG